MGQKVQGAAFAQATRLRQEGEGGGRVQQQLLPGLIHASSDDALSTFYFIFQDS